MASLRILDNMPEMEEERTPDEVRGRNLVDPLPHLTVGRWSGVDVEQFLGVKKEKAASPQFGILGGADLRRRIEPKPEFEPPVLMLRTLDFTVERGRTYRYRSRVVVVNVKRQKGDNRLKLGPWSQSTEIITIPFP
jgi:hypothetical protein